MSPNFLLMRKLYWVLLLPLVLLFVQEGEVRHEYGHYGATPGGSQKKAPDPDHCPLCLAYAHLSGAARSEAAAPPLLSYLSFHHAPAFALARDDIEVASPRSRGPPAL